MSNIKSDPEFTTLRIPIVRVLLTNVIGYFGYLVTAIVFALWTSIGLVVVSLYSNDATKLILHLLVDWGGEVFAIMEVWDRPFFGANANLNDVNGIEAFMILSGWVSLAFYVLGSLFSAVFRKRFSVSSGTKVTLLFYLSLAVYMAILFSTKFRFESGMAPDSMETAGLVATISAPILFLSGCASVGANLLVKDLIEYVNRTNTKDRFV